MTYLCINLNARLHTINQNWCVFLFLFFRLSVQILALALIFITIWWNLLALSSSCICFMIFVDMQFKLENHLPGEAEKWDPFFSILCIYIIHFVSKNNDISRHFSCQIKNVNTWLRIISSMFIEIYVIHNYSLSIIFL